MTKQISFSWDVEDRQDPRGSDFNTYKAAVLKVNDRKLWASLPELYIRYDEDAEDAAVNALIEFFYVVARSNQS